MFRNGLPRLARSARALASSSGLKLLPPIALADAGAPVSEWAKIGERDRLAGRTKTKGRGFVREGRSFSNLFVRVAAKSAIGCRGAPRRWMVRQIWWVDLATGGAFTQVGLDCAQA